MKKLKIKYFIEYKNSSYDFFIPDSFYKKGLCEEDPDTNKIKFKIVGFLTTNDYLIVIFPKGMNIYPNHEINQRNSRLLLKAILKYGQKPSMKQEHISFGVSRTNNPLTVAYWLMEDYLNNGLIKKNFYKKEQNGNGKINWPKTIKESSPYLISNQIYYLNPVTVKSFENISSELTIIHANILEIVNKNFGWLFDFELTEPRNYECNLSTHQMIFILNQARRETFTEREVFLYNYLIKYIENNAESGDNITDFFTLYTKYFQYIWENICKELFRDESDLRQYVPNPYWEVNSNRRDTKQIPDVLFKNNNDLFILDAKYYQAYEGFENLPGWHDIVKQLFYSKSLNHVGFSKINNIFIFPSPNGTFDIPLLKHGFASVKDKETEFGKVKSFELNTESALKNYVSNSRINFKQLLIDIL